MVDHQCLHSKTGSVAWMVWKNYKMRVRWVTRAKEKKDQNENEKLD